MVPDSLKGTLETILVVDDNEPTARALADEHRDLLARSLSRPDRNANADERR